MPSVRIAACRRSACGTSDDALPAIRDLMTTSNARPDAESTSPRSGAVTRACRIGGEWWTAPEIEPDEAPRQVRSPDAGRRRAPVGAHAAAGVPSGTGRADPTWSAADGADADRLAVLLELEGQGRAEGERVAELLRLVGRDDEGGACGEGAGAAS
jgi:hypothetical protein